MTQGFTSGADCTVCHKFLDVLIHRWLPKVMQEGDDLVDSRVVSEPGGGAKLQHMETDGVKDEQTLLRYSAWVCVCDCWVSLAVLSTFHFKTHIYRVESRDRWGNFAVVLTILQSKLLNHRKRWFPGPATPPLVILSGSAFRLLLMMINPKNSMDIFWL